MLIIRDGKNLNLGQKVKVYRNLNKPQYFSICDYKTGLVVAYAKSVLLTGNILFKVSEKSRQRVLKNRRRNVHAWVVGLFSGVLEPDENMNIAYYNPYLTEHFVEIQTNKLVSEAAQVICHGKYVYYEPLD